MKNGKKIIFLLILILIATLASIAKYRNDSIYGGIKVGLVFSETGWRSDREASVQKGALMAIDEINRKGGLLRKKIKPIIKDARSTWEGTKQAVEELILNENVAAIFGCWNKGSHY